MATDYTDANLLAIRSAIAKGERSVTFADRSVTYRSLDELIMAEARIARALDAVNVDRRSRQSYAVGSKGL